MEGTFHVTLGTPIGPQSGTITFVEQGGKLNGTIRAMGNTSRFSGHADGNSFSISGVLGVGFLQFRFTAQGTVSGDILTGTAVTDAGTFRMTGTRVH